MQLRSAARLFDLFWETGLVLLIIGVLVDLSHWGLAQYVVFVGVVGLQAALFVDSLIIGILGTTPGKFLCGIRTCLSNLKYLGVRGAFRRNFDLLRTGVVFDIFPFLPAAFYQQVVRLRAHRRTTYDRRLSVEVFSDRRYAVQVWSGLCLAVFLSWLPILAGLSGNQFSANGESTQNLAGVTLASIAFSDTWPSPALHEEIVTPEFGLKRPIVDKTALTRESSGIEIRRQEPIELVWTNPYSGYSTALDTGWQTEFHEHESLIT